ncbi:MAG TPA: endonuclease/exonuclease/phosphatase family protein [Patescibacteria group bacterium]|nr:endonuclease/exonuclease/phosphatase family protein [Patescibacteria group bacterium]
MRSNSGLKIAAWNVARGLSDPQRTPKIIDGIESLGADVVVLSESLKSDGQYVDPDFAKKLGFYSMTVGYDDAQPHTSGQQYLTMLAKLTYSAERMHQARLATRNGVIANMRLGSTSLRILGVHHDDRDEDKRLTMAACELASYDPDVIAGDLNAMHGGDSAARVLNHPVTKALARMIPHARAHSLATRLTNMASGRTIMMMEDAGMTDADPEHRPTMIMHGRAIVQLDHIMYAEQRVRASDPQVHTFDGSDHYAISAFITPVTRPE